MKNINKTIFKNAVTCPLLGWMMTRGDLDREPTLAEQFRMEQGLEIGKRARNIYPEGHLIPDTSIEITSTKTNEAMNDSDVSVIIEGSFLVDSYAAKADILKREPDGWHMIEVKSSTNDRAEFIGDMAYTTMVINRCGYKVNKVSLLLVSKEYRLGMDDKQLFKKIDHTNEVLPTSQMFNSMWDNIKKIIQSDNKPTPIFELDCKKCEIFKECNGENIDNHIFDIPRLSQSKFEELIKMGIISIENIPSSYNLSPIQSRVRECVQNKKQFVGGKLKEDLDSISWPAYYLDFESIMTAIPLFPDVAPYTQIPTQYSIHKCSKLGTTIDHVEYLADPNKDWRRDLAINLIKHLNREGSIIGYGNFEKNMINNLKEFCPDLVNELDNLLSRLIDFAAIIKKNYYHPGFHGSTSVKTTLPVLVPDMSYEGMVIADGDTASATFAYLAQGKYGDKETEKIKGKLRAYCKQDSLAMVKLHEKLYTIIN